MLMPTRFTTEATSFLTERLGHAAAPSWRYDLMRCVPKLVAVLAEAPDGPEAHAADLRPQIEKIIEQRCDCAAGDPVAMQKHVALIVDAFGELHGEAAPRDTALMRPLGAG